MNKSINELRSRLVELRDAADTIIRHLDSRRPRARDVEQPTAEEGTVIEGQFGFDLVNAAIQALDNFITTGANWWTLNKPVVDEALLPPEMRSPARSPIRSVVCVGMPCLWHNPKDSKTSPAIIAYVDTSEWDGMPLVNLVAFDIQGDVMLGGLQGVQHGPGKPGCWWLPGEQPA
jgi:hypothetical protein